MLAEDAGDGVTGRGRWRFGQVSRNLRLTHGRSHAEPLRKNGESRERQFSAPLRLCVRLQLLVLASDGMMVYPSIRFNG